MPKNALRICYESTTIFGIESSWPKFWTAPNFCHEFPIAQEVKELTTNIKKNQLRTSRTDYDSTTNPNIYQFVAIRGIRGLCGMGA